MSVKRMKATDEIPVARITAPLYELPEYVSVIQEIERGLGDGEKLEVTIRPDSAKKAKLTRPAMSVVNALRRYLSNNNLRHQVIQRSVAGEPWPRVYIIGVVTKKSNKS